MMIPEAYRIRIENKINIESFAVIKQMSQW